jgi:long-chain acyl-CoA synthetase
MKAKLTQIIHNFTEPQRPVLHFLADEAKGEWHHITRDQMRHQVLDAAAGLLNLGVGPQQNIGIFSGNRPEVIIADFAAWQLRAVPVSIYSTSSVEQVKFIVDDARISLIIVGSQKHYDYARRVGVETIISIDPAVKFDADDLTSLQFSALLANGRRSSVDVHNRVAAIAAEANADDLATLIYTSGTTGEPKGAMLTHGNFNAAIDMHVKRLTVLTERDSSLCFLPLSHIFELAWTCFCLYMGMEVYVNQDPTRVQKSLRETLPTCMCAVPRFWEKIYTIVNEKIANMNPLNRLMVKRALSVGRRRNLEYVRCGRRVPALLEASYKFYDKLIYSKLRHVIGLDNGKMFPAAGAPIAPEIANFTRAVGIGMIVGYGLSETTATVSCFPFEGYELASVGTPLQELQVRIGDDDEIQVKGATIMTGYYNRPEATAEAFTADGWFRTGDAGRIDERGNLYITDRIKDLFKTSNGKYVAPQAIESRLGTDMMFEQVAVIGDQRKFVSALIVPNLEALRQAAQKAGISAKVVDADDDTFCADAAVTELALGRIAELTADFARHEKIKRITLLPKPFTMASGEMTNTLKLRRKIIVCKYADVIDRMYAD